MQIIWHGQSCFEIIAPRGKGETVSILIDPLDEETTGLKIPKISADVVLVTNNQYVSADLGKIAPDALVIDSPGEYEVKGIYIQGIASAVPVAAKEKEDKKSVKKEARESSPEDFNTIYSIEADEMQICHLGNLKQAELAEDQISKIGNVDILMCPAGGGNGLDAKQAVKVMAQIEPRITIPMNYEIPKLKLDAGALSDFLKSAGVPPVEPLAKLTIKKKDISPEEAKIIVLEP